MISTLIVDDELHHQELLGNMVRKNFPQLELKHICSSVEEGIDKITLHKPQLVFLDVMLHSKTGFDLLEAIPNIDFDVIFTTSYEQYALQALKVSAVDFLLKPFGLPELKTAIEKFEARHEIKRSFQHIQNLLHNLKNNTSDKIKIALPTTKGFIFVQVIDIVRCESDNVYSTFYFLDKTKMIVSKPLKECEQLLTQHNFFRAHASHLINMRHLKEYIKGEGGTIKMIDGSNINLSRMRKDDFLKCLNKL
jgi:two-component system, LytTR family, response regulator